MLGKITKSWNPFSLEETLKIVGSDHNLTLALTHGPENRKKISLITPNSHLLGQSCVWSSSVAGSWCSNSLNKAGVERTSGFQLHSGETTRERGEEWVCHSLPALILWIYKNIRFCSPPHFSLLPPHSQERLMINQVLEQLSYLSWVSCNGKNVTGLRRLNDPLQVAVPGWGEQELGRGQSRDSWANGRAAPYGVCLARKAPCKEEGGHQSLPLFSGATRKWLPITFWRK